MNSIRKRTSLLTLIITNLLPILGIIYLDWSGTFILFCYWLETIIVLLFTILKIYKSENLYTELDKKTENKRLTQFSSKIKNKKIKKLLQNFIYLKEKNDKLSPEKEVKKTNSKFLFSLITASSAGLFLGFIGLLIFIIFNTFEFTTNTTIYAFIRDALLVVTTLTISHAISYKKNFIEKKEYKTKAADQHSGIVFARIFLLIPSTVIGIYPPFAGTVLILIKTSFDALIHYLEHRFYAFSNDPSITPDNTPADHSHET